MDHTEGAQSVPLEAKLRDASVGVAVGVGGFVAINAWGLVLLLVASPLVAGEITDGGFYVVSTLSIGLGTGTAAAVYLWWSGRDWGFIDLRVPRLRGAGYAIFGLVALFVAQILINVPLRYVGVEGTEHAILVAAREGDPGFLLVLIPLSILVVGPGEELLFRNVVQKQLYDAFSTWGAIIVASAAFAVVHFSAYATGAPVQMLTSLAVVLVLSLLLGWIYARTENVLVPALVHGAYDAIVFTSVYVQVAVPA